MAGLNVWVAGRREPQGKRKPNIVVMLHGFGKPRESLLLLADREAAKFGTIFIFPEAPVALDWRRRAWWRPKPDGWAWPVASNARNGRRVRGPKTVMLDQEVISARRKIIELLRETRRRFRVSSREILLAGFSQGATLALDVTLHLEEPVGGLAFLSGKPLDVSYSKDNLRRLVDVPVLMAHGRWDSVVPFATVDRMRRAMHRAGVVVTWVPFDGEHDIARPVQRYLRMFIRGEAVELRDPIVGSSGDGAAPPGLQGAPAPSPGDRADAMGVP